MTDKEPTTYKIGQDEEGGIILIPSGFGGTTAIITPREDSKWYNNITSKTANTIDKFRTVPRAMMILYMMLMYRAAEWFMSLSDPGYAQSVFLSAIIGAGAWWFQIYVGGKPNVSGYTVPTVTERRR